MFFRLTIFSDGLAILPFNKLKSKGKIKYVVKQIVKQTKQVVLSKQLQQNEMLIQELQKQGITIFHGKQLFFYLAYDCIAYIEKMRKQEMRADEITILINQLTSFNSELLIHLAQNVKRIHIVTEQIHSFKKLEDYLEDELGISIWISNNKKKSLLKSKIILNIDFDEEQINRFSIYRTAFILNLQDNIEIKTKSFLGIHGYDYQITCPWLTKLPNVYKKFNGVHLYESNLDRNKSYIEIRKQVEQEQIHIVNLIGKNGIIHQNEYLRI